MRGTKRKRNTAGILVMLVFFALSVSGCSGSGVFNRLSKLNRNGAELIFQVTAENPTEEDMNAVKDITRIRLDELGYTNGIVAIQDDGNLRVFIPGMTTDEEADTAAETLGAVAQLLFVDAEGNEILTGADIKDARAEYGPIEQGGKNEHYLSLEFTEEGQKKFTEATAKAASTPAPNNIIAITIDGTLLSAPTVSQTISSDSCIIHGNFEREQVVQFASSIKSGQLPFSLECIKKTILRE